MKLNGVQVVERHNHPGVLDRVILRANFVNNGSFQDVYAVSSVSLFRKSDNVSPSSILTSSTQLISDTAASTVKFRWRSDNASGWVDSTDYTTSILDASSVYRLDTGRYAVVLDGVQAVSSLDRSGTTIANTASSVGDYIDVWTVKMAEGTDWSVFIHQVKLYQDTFVSITEPLLMKSRTSLIPNKVRLGEIVDIKVPTEVTILNRNIDQSVKNTLSTGVIKDAKFRILKHNEDSNLPARVEVSGYSATESLVDITSDNTMLFSFDTAVLTNGSIQNLGAGTGTYSLEAKYTLLNETIISPMMYFTVR